MIKKYRIDLCYLGNGFEGWQTQRNGRTVQDYLNKALCVLFGQNTKSVGASRTDSGVHAEHQVAIFSTDKPIVNQKVVRSLNALTPENMSVISVSGVLDEFHPIYSSVGKVYRYRILNSSIQNPFIKNQVWQIEKPLNIEVMIQATNLLVGKFDFKSFCAADSGAKTTIRTIYEISVHKNGPLIEVWIIGNGFLKQMVRVIIGTLVEVGLGQREWKSIGETLESRDRTHSGKTAPARGLSLVRVLYDEIPSCSKIIENTQFSIHFAFNYSDLSPIFS